MTITEAARQLGLSPATLRVQLRNGKIRGVKRGRDWWITPAAVDMYRRNSLRERILAPDGHMPLAGDGLCSNRSCIAGCRDKRRNDR